VWNNTPKHHDVYPPQKNGVAKRMNMTLMDKEKSMLSGVGITQEFWAEAVDTTKYLVNVYPSLTLVGLTPHEVCFDKNPSLSHIKIFVCDAFVHVPKEKRSNMDNKAVKCIFIGYKEGMKGYKIWGIASRKIMYIQDVVFR
jgi:hypothetical protein